jgi:hypothetical protein
MTLITKLIQEIHDRIPLADVGIRLVIEIAARRDCQDLKTPCRSWRYSGGAEFPSWGSEAGTTLTRDDGMPFSRK